MSDFRDSDGNPKRSDQPIVGLTAGSDVDPVPAVAAPSAVVPRVVSIRGGSSFRGKNSKIGYVYSHAWFMFCI